MILQQKSANERALVRKSHQISRITDEAASWARGAVNAISVRWGMPRSWWLLFLYFHVKDGIVYKPNKGGNQGARTVSAWNRRKMLIQFHHWLGGSCYCLDLQDSYRNWKYTLRPSNMRPIDSPIWEACWHRDLARVRRLLDDGEATPWDVTENWMTPLHVSSKSSQSVCHISDRTVCVHGCCARSLSAAHRERR